MTEAELQTAVTFQYNLLNQVLEFSSYTILNSLVCLYKYTYF
jgi:hypothetical protein